MTGGKLSGGGSIPYAPSGLGGLYPDRSVTARGDRQGLSETETQLLAILSTAAAAGHRCPTNEDLADALGLRATSAPVWLMQRLEKSGMIVVERYQRERRVTIVETKQSTAAVRNPAPHWRDRPRDVPTPSPVKLRERRAATADAIYAEARRLNLEPAEFLADLVWAGWVQWQGREIQPGASAGVI